MNYNISPEELILKVSNIKPSGNVYADTYAVKHFGEYMYSVINYQKWKSCDTLEDNVFKCITELFPLSMSHLAKITQIFNESTGEVSNPSYTKTTVDRYIIDEYGKKYNISNCMDMAKAYLEFSQILYKNLTAVYKNYESKWKTIEDSYECVGDKIEEVYSELEDDYCKLDDKIDAISKIVDSRIISRYSQIFNEAQLVQEITDAFIVVMDELDTNRETKSLVMNVIVPENIGLHKLNYTMESVTKLVKQLNVPQNS